MKSQKKKIEKYQPSIIEEKWRKKWEEEGIYKPDLDTAKKPFYNLMMFPYPSAEGMHVGNMYAFTGSDIYGRYQRMKGNDVFEPIGLDGFGIHSENYAIKVGRHPSKQAKISQKNFYRQLRVTGNAFDWSRTLETYDPNYYKWTQWIFLQLYKKGLAYRKKAPVNFCPSCKTVLADEQVINGKCERCDSTVERKELEQWFFKITHYAEKLLQNIEKLDWSEKVKTAQRNWIGRSEGAEIEFRIQNPEFKINVFTVFPETIFGVTYMVLAPENPLVKQLVTAEHKEEVDNYIKISKKKSELERTSLEKEKTGVFTGSYCLNPVNGKKVPIWIADYVIAGYGTGAVMGVPGSDHRDFAFAKKYNLPIIRVIGEDKDDLSAVEKEEQVLEEGVLVNSGEFSRIKTPDPAKKAIIDWLEEKGYGRKYVQYHLRDWLISRQRYWGPPIPMIYCDHCKNRKYRYLLLHGRHGSSKRDFFPWLKKELESLGHEVYCPDLPNTEDPKVEEQANYVLKNYKLDSKTVIVGHSLGGAVTLNLLEKADKKVAKVILVDTLIYPKFNDKKRPDLEKNFNWQFNFEKIRKLSLEFIDLADINFPIIPKEQFEEKRRLLDTRLIYVKPQNSHFNSEIEPVILEYIRVDGISPVPEDQLPVLLPDVQDWRPEGTGRSPLANHPEFYKTTCPQCGGEARRETDVSDTFLDSSWYFFRYTSTELEDKVFDKEKVKKWLPVDMYIGGAEHSVLHLLYSRFITMVFKDLGLIDFDEPYKKFRAHGLIIAEGAKMSKSKGNVVIPDKYINQYGADTLRLYLMFMAPFTDGGDFRDAAVEGIYRFLKRVWQITSSFAEASASVKTSADRSKDEQAIDNQTTTEAEKRILNQTIKKVTEDIERLHYNTAISTLMELLNFISRQGSADQETIKSFLILLAPFAPYMTEELWQRLCRSRNNPSILLRAGADQNAEQRGSVTWNSIHVQPWPVFDPEFLEEEEVTIAIQINGKLREVVRAQRSEVSDQKKVEQLARESDKVKKYLEGKTVRKVVYVEGKILNFVTS